MNTRALAVFLAVCCFCLISGCGKSSNSKEQVKSSNSPQDAIRENLKGELAQRQDELLEEVAWYEAVETKKSVTISKLGQGGASEGSTEVPAGSSAIRLEFRTKKELLPPSIYRNPAKNYDMVFFVPKGSNVVAGSLPTKFAEGEGKVLGKAVAWKRR